MPNGPAQHSHRGHLAPAISIAHLHCPRCFVLLQLRDNSTTVLALNLLQQMQSAYRPAPHMSAQVVGTQCFCRGSPHLFTEQSQQLLSTNGASSAAAHPCWKGTPRCSVLPSSACPCSNPPERPGCLQTPLEPHQSACRSL